MKNKITICLTIAVLAISCGGKKTTPKNTIQEYASITIDTTSALIYTDFAAELKSFIKVDIVPRVSGYIDKIAVVEGSTVKKGQLLFLINQDDLQEVYNIARAQVDEIKAAVSNAELEIKKLTPLVENGIISEFELQNAKTNLAAAKAQLKAAWAQSNNAYISMGYARITAPVDGVVGRVNVSQGALVGANSSPLTSVASLGKISAYFSINENLMLDIAKQANNNGLKVAEIVEFMPEVSLILSNGETYKEGGKVEIASGLIDMTTGSAQLKAVFENKDNKLREGASAKVRINSPYNGVVVIPQTATYSLQDKTMVYVVDENGKVRSRNVELYGTSKNNYVIKSGLKIGEKIAAEGIDYIKEGDIIKLK